MRDKIEAALALLEIGNEVSVYRAKQWLREALQSTADDSEPITAEWCVANGAEETYPGYFAWNWTDRSVWYDATRHLVDMQSGKAFADLCHITTRGKLRHLLAAMSEDKA